jgi:FG-GAP-like repeat
MKHGTRSGLCLLLFLATAGPVSSQALGDGVAYPLDGLHPTAVAIADLNSDGLDDAAVGEFLCFPDCHLAMLFQTVGGDLAPPVLLPSGAVSSIAAGDLDGDSRTDVVVADGDYASVYFQQPDGTFSISRYEPPRSPFKVAIGDVTHDGRPDLVALPWGSNTDDLYVYEQQASGPFVRIDWTITADGYDDLLVADVNQDGLLDVLVVSGQSTPTVAMRLGDAASGFGDELLVTTPWGAGWAVDSGDFNSDGLTDLVVAFNGDRTIGLLHQDPAGSFVPALELPVLPWPHSVVAADLDANDSVDFATVGFDENDDYFLHGWLRGPSGSYRAERYAMPQVFSNYQNNDQMASGDLNGDGRTDVAVALDGGALAVFHGNPSLVEIPTQGPLGAAVLIAVLAAAGILVLTGNRKRTEPPTRLPTRFLRLYRG